MFNTCSHDNMYCKMHRNGSPAYTGLTLASRYSDKFKNAALIPTPMVMQQNDIF